MRASAVSRAAAAGVILAMALASAPASVVASGSAPDIKTLVTRYALAMHYDKVAKVRSITESASGFIGNRVVTYTTMAKAPDKMLEIITVDGTDDNIALPDSMFAPPGQ